MDHFAGLDVSVKDTSICIVDDTGRILREVKVASEPDALLAVLTNRSYHFKHIGLEAGPMSQWLFSALAEADLPGICVETRHMRAVLKAQINKTDRKSTRARPRSTTPMSRETRRSLRGSTLSNSTEFFQSLTRTTRASVQSRIRELDTSIVARSDDEVRERCQSLLGFVEQAWHVLHPGGPQYVPAAPATTITPRHSVRR